MTKGKANMWLTVAHIDARGWPWPRWTWDPGLQEGQAGGIAGLANCCRRSIRMGPQQLPESLNPSWTVQSDECTAKRRSL